MIGDLKRGDPCLAADDHGRNVWIIGGEQLNSITKYDSVAERWEDLSARLNVARSQASACFINDHLYVFYGMGSDQYFIQSVEKLNLRDPNSQWKLIEMAGLSSFETKSFPLVAPLNNREIMIWGGKYSAYMNIFDTLEHKLSPKNYL